MSDLNPITRREVFLAAAGGQQVETPEPITREEIFLKDIAENAGGGSNKFLVTLTPTSPDYSGTMDKTVAEINAAYEAGQEIWFNISALGMSVTFPLADVNKDADAQYPSFDAVIWNPIDGVVIYFDTAFTDDGTKDTYGTKVYSLTPAS